MSQPLQINRNVTKSYISLGGNVTSGYGNPAQTLDFAISRLSNDSVNVLQTSKYYSTPAFPKGSGPDFVNAAVAVETTLSAGDFLTLLHDIETQAGRNRTNRWEARTLDLDMISFGSEVLPDLDTYQNWLDLPLELQIKSAPEELIVPHPRVQDRAFVMIPLRDVAPDWVHPVTGASLATLIKALSDEDIASIKPLKP